MSDTKIKADPRFHDPRLVELYRLVAMRFWGRFVDARAIVEHYGGGILTEDDLGTNAYHAGKKYEAEADSALVESPKSARQALAFVEFAGILAADRLIGEVMHGYVNDPRDAYDQSKALTAAADFLNALSIDEAVEEERNRLVSAGARS